MHTEVQVREGIVHLRPAPADMFAAQRIMAILGGSFRQGEWKCRATPQTNRMLARAFPTAFQIASAGQPVPTAAPTPREAPGSGTAANPPAPAPREVCPPPPPPPAIAAPPRQPAAPPAPATTQTGAPPAPANDPASRIVIPQVALPDGLKVTPWKHQLAGYWVGMHALQAQNAFVLNAEMATGKTLIATMCAMGRGARRVLVVCPLRVIGGKSGGWVRQLGEYLEEPPVLAILDDKAGTAPKRATLAQQCADLAKASGRMLWVLVNYDSFWRGELAEWILGQKWDMVIYDEVHKIKSPGGKSSMFAKRLVSVSRDRIGASGTIFAHSPLDIYAECRALAPWIFGPSYATFKTRYAKLGGPDRKWVIGYQNIDHLEEKIAPITYRVTKREALPDLPEQIDVEYSTEFGAEAARIYRQLDQDLIAEVREGKIVTAANAMVKSLRLQQLTGGAIPTEDGHHHLLDDSKRKLLQDTLEDLGDQPVVVFARFRSDIDAIHTACVKLGIKSYELSGTRNQLEYWQRAEVDPKEPPPPPGADPGWATAPPQVLVVQVQSGSVGISLTRASVAIFYSLSHNLVEYDQSRARIHRPEQKRSCLYIYLTVQGTVDQDILAALRNRQDVMESIYRRIQERAGILSPQKESTR